MCWIAKHKNIKPCTAVEDITVYKIITKRSLVERLVEKPFCKFKSAFTEYVYKSNKTNPLVILNCNNGSIYEGYHSYSPNAIIENYGLDAIIIEGHSYSTYYTNFYVGKFIIPKDSEYYYNNNTIVSNRIIFTGKVKKIEGFGRYTTIGERYIVYRNSFNNLFNKKG